MTFIHTIILIVFCVLVIILLIITLSKLNKILIAIAQGEINIQNIYTQQKHYKEEVSRRFEEYDSRLNKLEKKIDDTIFITGIKNNKL